MSFKNSILAHTLTGLLLNHYPVQCRDPFLAEGSAAEESVEVLLREDDVCLIALLVDNVVFVQRDTGFNGNTFGRQFRQIGRASYRERV